MYKTFTEHQELCVVIRSNETLKFDKVDYNYYYTNQSVFLKANNDDEIQLLATNSQIKNNTMIIDLIKPQIVTYGSKGDFNMF